MQWRYPFVCLFVCRLKCVLVGQWPGWPAWPSSAIVLGTVSGRSAAELVRPVANILMAVGAYHVDHSGRTDLSYIHVNDTVRYLPRSVATTT